MSLRDAVLRFYACFSSGDGFDDVVSQDAALFVGTAEDEWFRDRAALASGFAYPGLRLEGGEPLTWEDGDFGWAADRPTLVDERVGPIRTRFSGVFRREEGVWRLLHSHFSVGVPDAEIVELQRRWFGP